ncbi:PREDICTED: uncharacterized protein LOC109132541 [Camelina sativa]|uniref:Uncharacterized protein LOC109132541 n=1 Tax=Camelina sativa TaxID=90675 RepID=A0ABM1RL67_CAMSA|nr:PREDICTED: uncharacterized protein LOC109132541 [Camelina sativa]
MAPLVFNVSFPRSSFCESSVTKYSRPDGNKKLIDYTGMLRDHKLSKLERGIDIHTTRSRGGSLVEEVIEKLERFKVRTVNILVGGDDEEQKK